MDHQNRFRLARSLTTIDVEAVAPASKARYSGLLVEQESEMRVNGGVLTSGVLRMVFAAILASTVSASAAEPRHISDPNKFCEEVLSTISSKALGKTVGLIAASTGQPDSSTGALANTLQIFEGKNFDFTKKVVDKSYNGGLRQIVYYSYVDKFGFFFFRFNFKMTSSGWLLANFAFKDET